MPNYPAEASAWLEAVSPLLPDEKARWKARTELARTLSSPQPMINHGMGADLGMALAIFLLSLPLGFYFLFQLRRWTKNEAAQ